MGSYSAHSSIKNMKLPPDVFVCGKHLCKKNRVLLKLKDNVVSSRMASIHARLGAVVLKEYSAPKGLQLLVLPTKISVKAAIAIYKKNPSVQYAEPDYYVHTQNTPNDPQFGEQWALSNTGQNAGVAGADVNGPATWDLTTGNRDVVLGIIDTGVLYTHPDLQANVWNNTLEIPNNNIDDDGNGYVDDVHGINAINKKGDPLDDNGHGSHVSGIMGAEANNGIGVSGINQKVSIVGCKFLDADGGGSLGDALTCMEYMVKLKRRPDVPVNLVATNNSWAGGDYSQAMMDAIHSHRDAGILFMAAASNDGLNNDTEGTYPANYPSANIISVAATDHKDELAYFSNHGRHSVHVGAPGVDILSTYLGNKYETLSGTSMATPYVTGMAGVIKSYNPSLDWRGIKNLIIAGGKPINSLQGKTISGRRLLGVGEQGFGSLTCLGQNVVSLLSPRNKSMTISAGTPVDFSMININCANPAGTPLFTNELGLSLVDDGKGGDDAAGDGVYSARWVATDAGSYDLDLGSNGKISINVYDDSKWYGYRPSTTNFNYRNISGTKLDLSDDSVQTIVSPFPVYFAGDKGGLTTLYVSSNGTISVTDNTVAAWQNDALPEAGFKTLIAPYWDDLDPSRGGGGVYYDVVGDAPNRELVVEWRDVREYEAHASVTFQVVFFESKGDILFNYLKTTIGSPSYNDGASATVGIQTGSTKAALYSLNKASVPNGTSLLFVQNHLPVANAGLNREVKIGAPVTLDASNSLDVDGPETLSYQWSLTNGPRAFVTNAQSAKATFVPTQPGIYTFRLLVQDDGGEHDEGHVQVTVGGN